MQAEEVEELLELGRAELEAQVEVVMPELEEEIMRDKMGQQILAVAVAVEHI